MPDYPLERLEHWLTEAEQLIQLSFQHIHSACSRDGRLDNLLLDGHQQVCFDLAVATAELSAARALLVHVGAMEGGAGVEDKLLRLFCAEVLGLAARRLDERSAETGIDPARLDAFTGNTDLRSFLGSSRSARFLEETGRQVVAMSGSVGDCRLDQEKEMMRATFRQFADDVVAPRAEEIHRRDQIIPNEILDGLRALGCFGLSVPQRYGGLLPDDRDDNLGMIVVTEELSRASLGGAGSLITRPEIMARAILEGGTEQQRSEWLPKLAQGEPLCAVAITEPDYGSDVASMRLKATRSDDGWILNGSKTWSTFAGKAGVLLTLARTDPDLSLGHRGLSLFLVEKPVYDETSFDYLQPDGGRLTGRAIDTIGYRGMHSFELFFDDYRVPASHLVGEGQGIGKGFYFTMRGFMGGRIQTAARACGVMQAAFEKAVSYGGERKVFGKPVSSYQLNRVKLARMAAYILASRQFTYAVGRLMDEGGGQVQASLVKLFACKASEWITREAMQIHGGMGYAEESAVSRYFLDARVLSIFEGTEETLGLKVVGRNLVEQAGPA